MKVNDAHVFKHTIDSSDWFKTWYFMADVHFDSPECDRKLLKRHLDRALAENASIAIFGDMFDAMGGKYDPRTNKGHIRPEYQHENYFDLIVDDAVSFFEPYAHLIKFISHGNHEYSVTKRHEIDLIARFIKDSAFKADKGDYTGFIKFLFSRNGGGRRSKTMYYTHGAGGNSPVTRGVIKTNRRSVSIDADFFVAGHIHETWNVPIPRIRLNNSNNIEEYVQEHIQLPTYKKSCQWAKSKDMVAVIRGAFKIRFSVDRAKGGTTIKHEITRLD